jgi:hypothetical protein
LKGENTRIDLGTGGGCETTAMDQKLKNNDRENIRLEEEAWSSGLLH